MLTILEQKRNEGLKAIFKRSRTRLAEFERRYRPYIYPLVRPQPEAADISTWCAVTLDEVLDGEARREQVMTWLDANAKSFEVLKAHNLVGFADPDEAFWFKMRWG